MICGRSQQCLTRLRRLRRYQHHVSYTTVGKSLLGRAVVMKLGAQLKGLLLLSMFR